MFKEFPKIYRLNRELILTEKLDGTNACVFIGDDGKFVHAQSRNRIITPENDNAGFARWCQEHQAELEQLGPGYHYGEWWGKGIQCGYGLDEKRFSLFNVSRWTKTGEDGKTQVPDCCHVVPTLGVIRPNSEGETPYENIWGHTKSLAINGSSAAPGFMKPEGIVIFHPQSGHLYKWTFEKDQEGKNSALLASNTQNTEQGTVQPLQQVSQ